MAPSIAIRSAAHLSNVLHGRTEAHPAASAAPPTSDSDDEMDASDDAAPAPFTPGGRIQGFNTAGRNAHSRPTPSHILLAVLSGETAGIPPLSSLSVLELTSNRFEQEYPHVTFAHASKELPNFAKGLLCQEYEISATPTFILFERTDRVKQVTRVISHDENHSTLPARISSLLAAIPKTFEFSGALGSQHTMAANVDPREARLARFAVLEATKVAEMSTASAMQIDAPPPAPVRLPSPEKRVAPPVFKNDPLGVSEADQYDVKHGIKSRSEIDFEKQQRVIAERAMEVKKHKEEKIASRNERERIKQQLEQDKAERKMRGGKLAGKLGVDGYNPDCLQKNLDGSGGANDPKKQRLPEKTVEEQITSCLSTLSGYRAGGDGGKTLSLLKTFVSNVIENPADGRFRSINTEGKAYSSKIKGKVGGKKLLLLCGFTPAEDNASLVLVGEPDLATLHLVRERLIEAGSAFDLLHEEALARLNASSKP